MWKSHLIIVLVLILLTLPVYFLDQYWLKPHSGNWISLDLRGLLVVAYLIFLAVEFTLSSLGVYFLPKLNLAFIHGLSVPIAIILVVLGIRIFN